MNELLAGSLTQFEIKGEAFIVTPQDEEELRNIQEALNYPTKENWKNR